MIKRRILESLSVMVHIGSEDVDLEQIFASAQAWREDPQFDPSMPTVWDLVAATIQLDWEEVKQRAPAFAEQLTDSRDPGGRTAWVVADDVTQIVVDSIHLAFPWATDWRVFGDAQAAVAWVREKD